MNHISYKSISSSASILQVLGILNQPKKKHGHVHDTCDFGFKIKFGHHDINCNYIIFAAILGY